MRPLTVRLVLATAGVLLAGPASAQWWNPFDDGGGVYRDAPPAYDPPPDVYADPPPLYDDADPRDPPSGYGTPPPGWRRPPPADLPYADDPDAAASDYGYRSDDPGYSNRRRLPPPDFRFDEDGRYLVLPDEGDLPGVGSEPPGGDPYGAPPESDWGAAGTPGQGLDPYGAPMETRRDPAAVAARALDALRSYLPAKRAAVAETDPFKRAKALRTANIWLIGQSVRPATGATLAAIDRVLGIDVSDAATTALPPAGTAFVEPEGKRAPADDPGLVRLADYARDKGYALMAGPAGTAEATAAETRLAEGIEGGLSADAVAGIDAYLGLAAEEAVAERPAPPRTGTGTGDDGGSVLR